MIETLFPEGVVAMRATEAMWDAPLCPAEQSELAGAAAKRRREFTAGRVCARHLLEKLGVRGFALLREPDRTPRWPAGVVGSISHCEGYCGVAVARSEHAVALGFDVERAGPLPPRTLERVCTEAERARIASLPTDTGVDWGKLHFSAKESFYKSYYPLTRTALGFRDVEIEIDPAQRRFRATLIRVDAPAAAGRRELSGRYAHEAGYVLTGVHLGGREAPGGRP